MVMVGRRLEISPGVYLFGDEVLNGIVIMILFTLCYLNCSNRMGCTTTPIKGKERARVGKDR